MNVRSSSLLAFLALAISAAACGARTSLLDDSAGTAGGASSSTGGPPAACTKLVTRDPVVTINFGVDSVRSPVIAPMNDGSVALGAIMPSGSEDGASVAVIAPFDAWPLVEPNDFIGIGSGITDFVLGPGAHGPAGFATSTGPDRLFTTLPNTDGEQPQLGGSNDRPLFVAGIDDRWVVAASNASPTYEVLHVSSYQSGSLVQSEDPLFCTTSPEVGAVVPSGEGFVAAFAAPNPPDVPCDPNAPKSGTVAAAYRYDSSPQGLHLDAHAGYLQVGAAPLDWIGLTPRSDGGAWLFTHLDGSASESPPPVMAIPLGADAELHDPINFASAIPVSPGSSPPFAVAAVGDGFALAWVDKADPSAPTIVVEVADMSGGALAQTTIETNLARFDRALSMVTSPDGRSLFLTWEAHVFSAQTVGAARVDCVE